MQAYLLVGLGGALGAVARYGTGLAVTQVWRAPFPLATLIVNIGGSLLMGLLVGWLGRALPVWNEAARLFLAVGVLGGFTTFSAYSLDAVTLFQRGAVVSAALYVTASVVLSIGALALGLLLARVVPA